jgi:GH35 family endo-1,4-beta-xylanase
MRQSVTRRAFLASVLAAVAMACSNQKTQPLPTPSPSELPESPTPAPTATPVPPTLQDFANSAGILLGIQVASSYVRNSTLSPLMSREFNQACLDGNLVWGPIVPGARSLRPSRDEFDFTDFDACLGFAERTSKRIHAQHLVWAQFMPV